MKLARNNGHQGAGEVHFCSAALTTLLNASHDCILEIGDSIDGMASITTRQLEASTKTRLRMRAASHGRSMEQEAREILKAVLTAEKTAPPTWRIPFDAAFKRWVA